MIEVLQQNSSGWWKGRIALTNTSASAHLDAHNTKRSYRIGVFPYNFVGVENAD